MNKDRENKEKFPTLKENLHVSLLLFFKNIAGLGISPLHSLEMEQ